jgi:hypothetical protein
MGPWASISRRKQRLVEEKARDEVTEWPWWSWLVLAPYFLKDLRAKVPWCLSVPLVILLHCVAAFVFLAMTMVLVLNL